MISLTYSRNDDYSSQMKFSLSKGYDPAVIKNIISTLKEARLLSPTNEEVLFSLGNAYYAARQVNTFANECKVNDFDTNKFSYVINHLCCIDI